MTMRPSCRGHGAAAALGAGQQRLAASQGALALQCRAVPLPWARHRQGDLGAVPREAAHLEARPVARAAAAVLGADRERLGANYLSITEL